MANTAEVASTAESQPPEDPKMSRFTWTIRNFTRFNGKKLYSDVFVIGGYKWWALNSFTSSATQSLVMFLSIHNVCLFSCRRVLIFPKGNNVDQLSMYLDVADSSSLPYGWSRFAQFSLAVINQIEPKYSLRKGITFLHAHSSASWMYIHRRRLDILMIYIHSVKRWSNRLENTCLNRSYYTKYWNLNVLLFSGELSLWYMKKVWHFFEDFVTTSS
jgi:hypothetical protein